MATSPLFSLLLVGDSSKPYQQRDIVDQKESEPTRLPPNLFSANNFPVAPRKNKPGDKVWTMKLSRFLSHINNES